jgi:hypothetical protein
MVAQEPARSAGRTAPCPTRRGSLLALVALVTVGLAHATPAAAQQESSAAGMTDLEEPSRKPTEVTILGRRPPTDWTERLSPEWTQTRGFAGTRFWLLDPGKMELEAWYTADVDNNGVKGDLEHLWQLEFMMGVVPHVQLDVYFNYAAGTTDGPHIEGAQIEGRFSLARHYGDIFANPTLYVEWHPQTDGPNRGEVRLLLGGQLFTRRLHAVINPYLEQNLDRGPDGTFQSDREVGSTGALGYAVVPRVLQLGGEFKAGADQEGGASYKTVVKVGPSVWIGLFKERVRITFSGLFGLTRASDTFNPILVVGYHL